MNRIIELFIHGCRYIIHKLFYRYKKLGTRVAIGKSVIISDPRLISIGNFVHLQDDVWLNNVPAENNKITGIIEIGDNSDIGKRCFISSAKKIKIEDNVLIAPNVHISDHSHAYQDIRKPVISQKITDISEVVLKKGCWIGINSVILPGVTIGKNSVIGANSVVTKSIPDMTLAVGAPAKVIKKYNPKTKKWVRIN